MFKKFIEDESGVGVVELILILVEKNQRQRTLYL